MSDYQLRINKSRNKDCIENNEYLECLEAMIESGVTCTYIIQALLMSKFPDLGIDGAILVVEYWQNGELNDLVI